MRERVTTVCKASVLERRWTALCRAKSIALAMPVHGALRVAFCDRSCPAVTGMGPDPTHQGPALCAALDHSGAWCGCLACATGFPQERTQRVPMCRALPPPTSEVSFFITSSNLSLPQPPAPPPCLPSLPDYDLARAAQRSEHFPGGRRCRADLERHRPVQRRPDDPVVPIAAGRSPPLRCDSSAMHPRGRRRRQREEGRAAQIEEGSVRVG